MVLLKRNSIHPSCGTPSIRNFFDKIYPKVFAQISAEREEFERLHQDILGPETDEVETPILLSDQEVQYRLDSLYWVFQHGMPAYGWIEGWQRPLPTPPYK